MKISFIIPRWPKNSFWDVIAFKFPLLSSSLLAGLTPSHYQFRIIDESLAEIDFDQEVDLVAITAITPLAPRGYEIADEFRRRGKKVVVGGIHASWLPEEAKAHSDSVAIGEADEVWSEILEDAEKGTMKPFYRQKERTDLSRLPIPRRDLFPTRGYLFHNLVQTTRGCPYDCEFCSVTALHGRSYRMRPVSEVEKEIQSLERSKAYIFFVDDNLVGNLSHAKELLTMLSHYRLRWVSQGPIHIAEDKEMVSLMAKAGCHGLFIGFESLREENLTSWESASTELKPTRMGSKDSTTPASESMVPLSLAMTTMIPRCLMIFWSLPNETEWKGRSFLFSPLSLGLGSING